MTQPGANRGRCPGWKSIRPLERRKESNIHESIDVTIARVMTTKVILLAFSWVSLFHLPLCCCSQGHKIQQTRPSPESCGHCHKEKHSPASPLHSKACACSHVSQDATSEFSKVSMATPRNPDYQGDEPPENAGLLAQGEPGILPFLGRGPPPSSRPSVPRYLLILHLLI